MRPAPRKVYVAERCLYCEGFEIIGIYANWEDADAAGQRCLDRGGCDWYEIEEFEVQDA